MNNQVATNAQGERDDAAAAMANQTNKSMMLFMPIMSLVFCFTMPAAISVYWIAQAVFGMIQDYFLTKHYRKIYDAEDEESASTPRNWPGSKQKKRRDARCAGKRTPILPWKTPARRSCSSGKKKKQKQPPRHTPGSTPRKQGRPGSRAAGTERRRRRRAHLRPGPCL